MPTRRYGQHFLTDPAIVRRIVEASGVTGRDAVLEIGPGRGILTRALASAAERVLSIEIDRRLHASLAEEGLPDNVELMRADALSVDPAELSARLGDRYLLVSNLPYDITARTLERFLPLRTALGGGPVSLTLMLQKEVVERMTAKPGSMNRLALFCGYYAECRLLFGVSRGAFSPPPRVDSCVVRLDLRRTTPLSGPAEARLFKMIGLAFVSKRRKIKNLLGAMLGPDPAGRLARAGIPPEARPEEISLKQWMTLVETM